MTCPIQPLPQPQTLDQLKEVVEAIYKPLLGNTFKGCIIQKNSPAVCTGGPRDVVQVESQDIQLQMQDIEVIVDEVSKMYIQVSPPIPDGERVWKGITARNYPTKWLWVTPCKDDVPQFTEHQFTVQNIEVLTGLNWVKKNYVAMVNISLV